MKVLFDIVYPSFPLSLLLWLFVSLPDAQRRQRLTDNLELSIHST